MCCLAVEGVDLLIRARPAWPCRAGIADGVAHGLDQAPDAARNSQPAKMPLHPVSPGIADALVEGVFEPRRSLKRMPGSARRFRPGEHLGGKTSRNFCMVTCAVVVDPYRGAQHCDKHARRGCADAGRHCQGHTRWLGSIVVIASSGLGRYGCRRELCGLIKAQRTDPEHFCPQPYGHFLGLTWLQVLLRYHVQGISWTANTVRRVRGLTDSRMDRKAQFDVALEINFEIDPAQVAVIVYLQRPEGVVLRFRDTTVRTHHLPLQCEEADFRGVEKQSQDFPRGAVPGLRQGVGLHAQHLFIGRLFEVALQEHKQVLLHRHLGQLLQASLQMGVRHRREGTGARIGAGAA